MRVWALAVGTALAALGVVCPAGAQSGEVIDLDAVSAEQQTEGTVDLDAPEPTASPGPAVSPEADVSALGPVVAGQMTRAAADAKKLFDRERWAQAALALKRVVDGKTGDDPGNRQMAQYFLAISLYRMNLLSPAAAIFMRIADNTRHIKFKETLLWLAKLATQRPGDQSVLERVCQYGDGQISRFDNGSQRDLYWQLNFMCGRLKYRNRAYQKAIRFLHRVQPPSRYFGPAQVLCAQAYHALGLPGPARRVLWDALTKVPEEERGPLRQVSAYLEYRHAQPGTTWRNPALRYWRARGFTRRAQ